MNPYASFLGNRNPIDVARETPRRLTVLIEKLGSAVERSPAEGKWSARQILCHLADSEIAFGFRFRQALAETNHVIQPFDQDAWAKPYSSGSLDARKALEAFAALRRWNVALLETMGPEQFSKPLKHPERGAMTFQTVLETMAGHDLNHLAHIERIAGK
jgi:hypothetical protein